MPPPPLSALQKKGVLHFRRAGKTYKQIAELLACTQFQALYWWKKNSRLNYDEIHRAQAREHIKLKRMRERAERKQ